MYPLVEENMLIHKTEIIYGIYGNGEPIILFHGTPSPFDMAQHCPSIGRRQCKVYVLG